MEGGEKNNGGIYKRSSRNTREHFNLTADNERLHFEALRESQKLKIKLSNSKPKSKSVRIFSGRSQEPRLREVAETINSRSEIKTVANNDPEIRETKNEILSRTLSQISTKNILRILLHLVIMCLILNVQFGAVDSASVKAAETSLSNLNKELPSNRTLKNGGGEHWVSRKSRKQHKKPMNKNCKEYDITSRAFLADLIFEGTARSRSKRASGRYVTFVIQKILKQKNNLLRPKTQIRLHFGGKANRKLARVNPLNDCPLNSITSSNRAMVNLKVGENYYVFADHFGLMNYTAKGEPIVVNRRNLKSIRSVLSKNKGE